MIDIIGYVAVAVVSFFSGGALVWYITSSSRDKRAKNIIEKIASSLEDIDRDYWVQVEMRFGIPGFASTTVTLDEKNE